MQLPTAAPLTTGAAVSFLPDIEPRDGERTVTVVAELNRAGQVTAVVLRPDDFTTANPGLG
jgi:hypothetical protein